MKFTTKAHADKKGLKFSKKIDYISREKAIENNSNFFQTNKEEDITSNKKFSPEKEGYISRVGAYENRQLVFNEVDEKNRSLYYCSEQGVVKEKDIKDRMENIKAINKIQQKNKSCLYSSAISFTKEFSEKNLYKKYTEEEMYERLNPIIKNYLVVNNFSPDNTIYFITAHTNEEYFHFHLEFLEKEPTRNKNKFNTKNLESIKKNLHFALNEELKEDYQSENIKLGKIKTQIRELANIDNKDFFEGVNIEKAVKLYSKRKVRYYKDIKDENLIKEINSIRGKIEKKPEIKKKIKEMEEITEKIETLNFEIYGSKGTQRKNQEDEIKLMLNNYILKNIKLEKPNLSYEVKSKFKKFESKKIQNILERSKRNKEKLIDDMNYQLNQKELT